MTLTILSLEDEADVRDALERDLEQFWDKIRLEVAEDVDDAWAVIDEIVEDGDELALVLSDHRLPGKSGVDFLVELMQDERFGATRTVLVTGQADQSDTIRAVNQAGLDYSSASRGTRRSCEPPCVTSSPSTSWRSVWTPCPT